MTLHRKPPTLTTRLVLEIGTEELPPAAVRDGVRQLSEAAPTTFHAARIPVQEFRCAGTPRRLVLIANGVALTQDELVRDVRGPAVRVAFTPDGSPTKAAEGFARAQGVRVGQLERRATSEGEYVYVVRREKGQPTARVLQELLPTLVQSLTFAKSMRWTSSSFRFARPIRWILALLGAQVLRLELAGLKAGRRTYGHRTLRPGPISISSADDYEQILSRSFVVLDPARRRDRIMKECLRVARGAAGRPILDPDLLEETTNIVEWPTAFVGHVAGEFGDLPRDVLITVMQHHQKYFAVENDAGRLLPVFVAVRDGDAHGLATVRQGNEWVLKARLSDATFFFEEDKQRPLSSRVEELRELVFHEKLGTMWDKTQRLRALALRVSDVVAADAATVQHLERAAHLSKADLVTLMVRELPELQGIMGGLYARHDGEPEPVWQGISEQYLPRGAAVPRSRIGTYLALLDKVDTLIGALAVGIRASGSEDPYGLRRAAGGVVQLIMVQRLHLSMRALSAAALDVHNVTEPSRRASVTQMALDFMLQRFRSEMIIRERGISYDTVDAVLACGADELADAEARAWALQVFRNRPEFLKLYAAVDRAARILPPNFDGEIRESLIKTPSEVRLLEALQDAELRDTLGRLRPMSSRQTVNLDSSASGAEIAKTYQQVLQQLAGLATPVNRFFDDVLVMDPDQAIRENRLALLAEVVGLSRSIADFSKLVVGDAAREGKPSPVSQDT